jgi:predicted transcriptional regulator
MTRWEEYQETGEAGNNEAMIDWLDSWGTDHEKLCSVK